MRLTALTCAWLAAFASPAFADGLRVQYPSDGHITTADRIFVEGTATAGGTVTLNGQAIHRSDAGHFAPTAPLRLGRNVLTLKHGGQTLSLTVVRNAAEAAAPPGAAFVPGSLLPTADRAVQPGEAVTLGVLAGRGATVTVRIGGRTIPLPAQPTAARLPDNKAGLTGTGAPIASALVRYAASTTFRASGPLGKPVYTIVRADARHDETPAGGLSVLSPEAPSVIEVMTDSGVARSGPSTDYSRLTPLPKGTRAAVTGRDGNWLRLSYGAFIDAAETRPLPGATLPLTVVRSLRAKAINGVTEVSIPLQVPVPMTVEEADGTFTLTLHHAVAQTDLLRLDPDALVSRLDWTQDGPERIQYKFRLNTRQSYGWSTRYEGSTLVLVMKHQPMNSLNGLRVVLDAGHGGPDDGGTHGPDGTAEKDLTLTLSKLVREELQRRGAIVTMTRVADVDLGLKERQALIAAAAPDVSVSLHFNALPDQGDAENTRGVGGFWYNAQSHSLAVALHDAITTQVQRPSYGIWWDNLALTRPSVCPAVLMEIGFLTNPEEFAFCADPAQQRRVAAAIADGLSQWTRDTGKMP